MDLIYGAAGYHGLCLGDWYDTSLLQEVSSVFLMANCFQVREDRAGGFAQTDPCYRNPEFKHSSNSCLQATRTKPLAECPTASGESAFLVDCRNNSTYSA